MPDDEEYEGEPSDRDWMRAAGAVERDMDGFNAYIWPVYRDLGLSRDAAAICFYLHLVATSVQRDD